MRAASHRAIRAEQIGDSKVYRLKDNRTTLFGEEAKAKKGKV
jgi:hypothetical protein